MKKQIGVVGVDSGQILLTDPCYLDTWKTGNIDDAVAHPVYRDKFGKLWQYSRTGHVNVPGFSVQRFPGSYEDPIGPGKACPNQLIASGWWKLADDINERPKGCTGAYSYAGACDATLGEGCGGQLNFEHGHEGAGVAVSSGYGDGTYPVYAHYNKDGRVRKVEIVFIKAR
jgi:hypothetical protein